MKHSEILREAKNVLWDGRSSYRVGVTIQHICYAITLTSDSRKALKLRREIRRVLGGCHSLYQWLGKHAGVPEELLTERNMQEYRHRWLDELIRIYEKAGK